jgi:Na+/proline symporter
MLSFLPSGVKGLVVASLIAAFMSTISTQVNWGSSYVVNDFYRRFVNPNANESQLVAMGRWSTVILMIVTAIFALLLSNALQAFNILLQIGAGTGSLFILRWFWWRVNAYSELAAMIISFVMALYLELLHPSLGLPELSSGTKLLIGVGVTTVGWILVTYLTRPTDVTTLRRFYYLIQPGGPGWKKVVYEAEKDGVPIDREKGKEWDVPAGILSMLIGTLAIYSALFAVGNLIYGNYMLATVLTGVVVITTFLLIGIWSRLNVDILSGEDFKK